MMKRNKSYTINLTEEQAEKVEKLAKKARRKPREMLYLIIEDFLDQQQPNKTPTEYFDEDGVFNITLN